MVIKQEFIISPLNRNEVKAAEAVKERERSKSDAWMGMPIGPGSGDFNPCFLFTLSSLFCHTRVGGDRRRFFCFFFVVDDIWGGGGNSLLLHYRLHLLQNAISSLSSIPHLISSNNLPFSSCPNRESQRLREWVCRRDREESLLHQLFLTLTLSLYVC